MKEVNIYSDLGINLAVKFSEILTDRLIEMGKSIPEAEALGQLVFDSLCDGFEYRTEKELRAVIQLMSGLKEEETH